VAHGWPGALSRRRSSRSGDVYLFGLVIARCMAVAAVASSLSPVTSTSSSGMTAEVSKYAITVWAALLVRSPVESDREH
jgi:hypothetical protein